jgi:predicted NAD/FAD-dependent oxidoreductase
MNALARHLAAGLDVRCGQLAFSVHPGRVALDDGTCVDADAVVVAVPVPQALSLLMAGDVATPEALWHLAYDPTLALLVVLDGPGAVPEPGGVQEADEVFSFVADNHRKGVSPLPALTLHARPAWSRERYDDDPDAVHRDLLAAAGRWIGDAGVVESQLKKWRFATPTTTWTEPCLVLDTPSPIVLAGDAFAGPKMEGAALSGLAAAAAL